MTLLPGAASTTLRDVLTGPPRAAHVVGVHPACVYLAAGDDVLAVETADAIGLPCAVRLGVDAANGPLSAVRRNAPALVGGGRLSLGPVTVEVTRWWRPRRVRAADGADPFAASVQAAAEAALALADALSAHPAPVPVEAPARKLVGLGPGLTPAGDDVLAGILVGVHHVPALRDPLAAEVLSLVGTRTTALSAALLRHAVAGHGVPPLLDLADLLSGRARPGGQTSLTSSLERLLGVGHSSGTALAWGLLRGARAVAGRSVEEVA